MKTRILGEYYKFWWKITSGGPAKNYTNPTAIIDLNTGSGELYLEETNQTILGSGGHALALKYDTGLPTDALKVILVEENDECFARLRNVVRRRWHQVPLNEATGPTEDNGCGVYLLKAKPDDAIEAVESIHPGNSIFFFDPLLHVEWKAVDRVARRRIRAPFKTGTEFIVFLFTSDWFLGREYGWRPNLAPLPKTPDESTWTPEEAGAVGDAESLFGDIRWRGPVLRDVSRERRQGLFIDEYRRRLLMWWRFILPMPFIPKEGQLYHLISCSNYEAGIRVTRDFFCDFTGNLRYEPDNRAAFDRFKGRHPERMAGLSGSERPIEWKVLWKIIRQCEGGICDARCVSIAEQGTPRQVLDTMRWLAHKGYLTDLAGVPSAWDQIPHRYVLDWTVVQSTLGVNPPRPLTAVKPEDLMRQGQLDQWS